MFLLIRALVFFHDGLILMVLSKSNYLPRTSSLNAIFGWIELLHEFWEDTIYSIAIAVLL
jgi:hypothetical protein